MAAELPTSKLDYQMTKDVKGKPVTELQPCGGRDTHARMIHIHVSGKIQTDRQTNRLLEFSSLPWYVFSFPQPPLTLSILVTGTSDVGRMAPFLLWWASRAGARTGHRQVSQPHSGAGRMCAETKEAQGWGCLEAGCGRCKEGRGTFSGGLLSGTS